MYAYAAPMQTAIAKFPLMPTSNAMPRATKDDPEIMGKMDPPRQPKFKHTLTKTILSAPIINK